MRTIIILVFGLLATLRGTSQVSGPNSPLANGSASLPGSSASWFDGDFVFESDDKAAIFGDIPGGVGSYTDYLLITDFGFSISAGTVIYGIKVDIERSDPNLKTADYSIRIVKGGIVTGTNMATGLAYPAADAYQSYGGATSLWGETWSYKDVTNQDFGVALSAQRNAAGGVASGGIDHIRITVYYGFVTLPVSIHSFTATKENKSVAISWKTASEINMDKFVIERAVDGKNFLPVGTVNAANQSVSNYSFKDHSPLAGTSYYRIRLLELSGIQAYSKVASVSFSKTGLVTLSPSPWVAGNDLHVNNPANEDLTIQFFSRSGQLIGKTNTSNSIVIVPASIETKGLVYFKVSDKNQQLKGTGTLIIE
jgi:hypothetical protein